MKDRWEQDIRLLDLISEALRTGPGTAPWRQALEQMGEQPEHDELVQLQRVRERLQAGKKWREVRPGPGFTRRVMNAVDQQSDSRPRSTAPATIVAIICGILVLALIAALVPILLSRGQPAPTGNELDHIYFSTPWIQSNFENSISGEWKTAGSMPLRADHGLHVTGEAAVQSAGGGIISTQSLPADQFFSLTATLTIPPSGTVGQIFVTNDLQLDPVKGTGGRELSVGIDQQSVRIVLPDGEMAKLASVPHASPTELRLLIGPEMAAVEVGGKKIWSGPNGLDPSQRRYVGARIIAADGHGEGAVIDQVTVMKGKK